MTFLPDAEERPVIDDVFSSIAEVALLPEGDAAARKAALTGATVIVTRSLRTELRSDELPLLAGVKLLQTISAGFNHLPFAQLPSQLPVASNSGGYAEPMAEHVVAMALAAAKRLAFFHNRLAADDWIWGVKNKKIGGSVCGILGFGGIGQATARLCRGLGIKVWATNRSGKTDQAVDFIGTPADTEKVLRGADTVVLSVALNAGTKGSIGARELGMMKKDATLINVARGDAIDQKALYEHLKANPDFYVCIDAWWVEPFNNGVFKIDYPFFNLPNVIGSPHNSAHTATGRLDGLRHAAENAARAVRGETPKNLVAAKDRV